MFAPRSTSSLAKLTAPASFCITCSRTGAITRQGEHHSAQKSTNTGRSQDAVRTSLSKASSDVSKIVVQSLYLAFGCSAKTRSPVPFLTGCVEALYQASPTRLRRYLIHLFAAVSARKPDLGRPTILTKLSFDNVDFIEYVVYNDFGLHTRPGGQFLLQSHALTIIYGNENNELRKIAWSVSGLPRDSGNA